MPEPLIIDRRKNASGKNLTNRQRFIQRAKDAVKESAKKALAGRSIKDTNDTGITISNTGIDEPSFSYDYDYGFFDFVMTGNEEFLPGDMIPKNKQKSKGQGRGGGSTGSGEDIEDAFGFSLTYEEYLNIIFDDLELPDLVKKSEKSTIVYTNQRAGFTNTGVPANLNVEKTMISGLGRRIALRSGKVNRLHELQEKLQDLQAIVNHGGSYPMAEGEQERFHKEIEELKIEIEELKERIRLVPFLDRVDLRYNNYTKTPKPMTKAVMICILDVSYSMGQMEKIIAKKFFLLLSLFLRRKYEQVDVVFIKHHDRAKECDEEEFFTSKESGGTVVSTAYDLADQIIKKRYSPEDWNIYITQASDGDNAYDDHEKAMKILVEKLLPVTQYFTYIEINNPAYVEMMNSVYTWTTHSWLYETMRILKGKFKNIAYSNVNDDMWVVPVFRKIFEKKGKSDE